MAHDNRGVPRPPRRRGAAHRGHDGARRRRGPPGRPRAGDRRRRGAGRGRDVCAATARSAGAGWTSCAECPRRSGWRASSGSGTPTAAADPSPSPTRPAAAGSAGAASRRPPSGSPRSCAPSGPTCCCPTTPTAATGTATTCGSTRSARGRPRSPAPHGCSRRRCPATRSSGRSRVAGRVYRFPAGVRPDLVRAGLLRAADITHRVDVRRYAAPSARRCAPTPRRRPPTAGPTAPWRPSCASPDRSTISCSGGSGTSTRRGRPGRECARHLPRWACRKPPRSPPSAEADVHVGPDAAGRRWSGAGRLACSSGGCRTSRRRPGPTSGRFCKGFRPRPRSACSLLMLLGLWLYTFTITGSLPRAAAQQGAHRQPVRLLGLEPAARRRRRRCRRDLRICRSWGFSRRAISTSVIVTGVWNIMARLRCRSSPSA